VPEALILRAGRSPFGARHGRFAQRHPAELLGEVLAAVLRESGTDPGAVDEVLVGCATPVGAQAANVATAAARAAGGLTGVPASVVSTQDTSSLVALLRAVDAVRSSSHRSTWASTNTAFRPARLRVRRTSRASVTGSS